MRLRKSDVFDVVFIECPYCRVCSIRISDDDYKQVKAGQQMVEVCQVCGKEVYIDDD